MSGLFVVLHVLLWWYKENIIWHEKAKKQRVYSCQTQTCLLIVDFGWKLNFFFLSSRKADDAHCERITFIIIIII